MRGTMLVQKLQRKGKYVSEIDYDSSFIDSDNPNGFFKMVICPIDGKIYCCKTKNGFKILGECYIVSGADERSIDEKIRKRHYAKSDESIENVLVDENEL